MAVSENSRNFAPVIPEKEETGAKENEQTKGEQTKGTENKKKRENKRKKGIQLPEKTTICPLSGNKPERKPTGYRGQCNASTITAQS